MILADQVFKIGKFTKPHGIKGEIEFEYTSDAFDRFESPYLVCLVEGIFVPFFVQDYRFKGNDLALIKFEDIDTDESAKFFKSLEVFYPKKFADDDEINKITSLDFFLNFELHDNHLGLIGKIVEIDDSTINTLFLVQNKDKTEIIVPASDDLITSIDETNRIVYFDLPAGLID